GGRLRGARRLRGESRAALLRHAARAQHADLRDLGPRRHQRRPQRDGAAPHVPVLSGGTWRSRRTAPRRPPWAAILSTRPPFVQVASTLSLLSMLAAPDA